MNLAEALNTLALLLPGYFGAWMMSFIMGVRRREWSQMVLYSLIFSALTYYLLLRFTPPVVSLLRAASIVDLTGFQRALNEISNIGNRRYALTFHNVVKVIPPASLISVFIGVGIGQARRSEWFKAQLLRYTNRTQNTDIWSDFHERYTEGPHTVTLKNGETYFGSIEMWSDMLTGADRGIILEQSVVVPNSAARQAGVKNFRTPGRVLLFASEIATISDMMNPNVIRANRQHRARLRVQLRRKRQRNRWYVRLLRRARVVIRRLGW